MSFDPFINNFFFFAGMLSETDRKAVFHFFDLKIYIWILDYKLMVFWMKLCSWKIVMGDDKNPRTLKEFSIPDYILVPGAEIKSGSYMPTCPVIVFINTKSGGQLGGELLVTYSTLLNKNQVH